MNSLKFIFLFLLLTSNNTCFSQLKCNRNIFKEEGCRTVFKDFMKYINRCADENALITDNSSLKFVLLNYLFIERKLDSVKSTEIDSTIFKNDELNTLKYEINQYVEYFRSRKESLLLENLDILPILSRPETFVYIGMTEFQKDNTFLIFDKRDPQKILFYILFIPPLKGIIKEPRIWAWTLSFKYGKFFFTSPIGEVGYELLFP